MAVGRQAFERERVQSAIAVGDASEEISGLQVHGRAVCYQQQIRTVELDRLAEILISYIRTLGTIY